MFKVLLTYCLIELISKGDLVNETFENHFVMNETHSNYQELCKSPTINEFPKDFIHIQNPAGFCKS